MTSNIRRPFLSKKAKTILLCLASPSSSLLSFRVSAYTPLCTYVRSQFICRLHRETFPNSSKLGWVAPPYAPMERRTWLCSTWAANIYSTPSVWCISVYSARVFLFTHYLNVRLSNLLKTSCLSSGLSRIQAPIYDSRAQPLNLYLFIFPLFNYYKSSA